MNRFFLLAMLALLLANCSKPFELVFNTPTDFAEQFTMETVTTSESKVMGMDVTSVTEQSIDYTAERVAAVGDEEVRLRYTYTGIQHDMDAMQQQMHYDSEGSPAENDANLAVVYDNMLDKPWYLIYNNKGEIVGSEGLDELLSKAFETLPEEMRTSMEANFGGEALTNSFQMMTSYLPTKPVKVGESWPATQHIQVGGMTMDMNIIYTLKSRKDGQASIDIVGDISTDPEASTLDLGEISMTYDLTGTYSGNMLIEEATGWPVKSFLQQEMGGNVLMNMPAMGEMNMEMEMQIDQTIERK